MKVCNSKILKNEQVVDTIYKLVVEFTDKIIPGQFFMLKSLNNEFLLPRPISINDCDENTVTFLYRVEGAGTKVISGLEVGREIQVFGPLGNGFDIEKLNGKVAVIGGGIGTAPLLNLTKELGKKADVFLGFRDVTYGVEDFEKYANKVQVATEDGSVGYKGFVTNLVNFEEYDFVVTCGPQVMMDVVTQNCIKANTRCFVSLEKRMACGLGACLGCVVETTSGMKRVCKDGPVFEISELVRGN